MKSLTVPSSRKRATLQHGLHQQPECSYDKLDVSGFVHHRINHSKEFADHQNYINGIRNFWTQAKRVLRKHNGTNQKSFPQLLKECKFRFNFDTLSQQLKILRDWYGI